MQLKLAQMADVLFGYITVYGLKELIMSSFAGSKSSYHVTAVINANQHIRQAYEDVVIYPLMLHHKLLNFKQVLHLLK